MQRLILLRADCELRWVANVSDLGGQLWQRLSLPPSQGWVLIGALTALHSATSIMSSWSLVLWRPPPVFDSPAPEEPVYSLNPHVAALLRAEGHLPRPITLTHTLPPSTPPEEAGAAEEEEAPSPLPSVSETEPMDVDVAPEPLAESAEGMVVDEPEPAAEHDATPPTGTSLPSEEDEPSTGVRHQGMHKRPAAEPVSLPSAKS